MTVPLPRANRQPFRPCPSSRFTSTTLQILSSTPYTKTHIIAHHVDQVRLQLAQLLRHKSRPLLSGRPPANETCVFARVRTLTGKEIELDIESGYKVSQIKEKVEEKEGIPPVQQRLIYGGKQMTDDKTAADYDLKGGDTLHLVLALRGGRQ
ncbi:hypothetical protein NLG97_g2836 [Lecanicillium saksenae]|uniref:Uncharacterized protein n=1 Tax=Lecanicillium saksenae TaxID=468837 RepID=A0ACC1QZS8_9HYPO|nr:hypothetical protein NLG97_g2836 [Lecanicillium saksenae]